MKKLYILAALTLLLALAVTAYAGQSQPGSEDDPLVTKGYVDNYVDQAVAELEKEISRLEKRVAQLEALVGQQGSLAKRELKLTIGSTTAYFNGNPQTIDAAPYLEGSTTMLPFKVVGDALGATVKWEGESKTVIFQQGGTSIALQIGSRLALVNDRTVELDVAPVISNNRTFVPLRFVSTNLGAKVDWQSQTKTIVITK